VEASDTPQYVRIAGDGPTVSAAALKLHTYGVVVSIETGRAGFVADTYLDALAVDTSSPALELTLAGLWTREDDGYRVSRPETLRIAREIRRQLSEFGALGPAVRRFGS
jgi:hypothetical protein